VQPRNFRADFREKYPKTGKKRNIPGDLARFSIVAFACAQEGEGSGFADPGFSREIAPFSPPCG